MVSKVIDKVAPIIKPAIERAPMLFVFGILLLTGWSAQQYISMVQIRDLRNDFLRHDVEVQKNWADPLTRTANALEEHTKIQIKGDATLESLVREMTLRRQS